MNRMWRYLLFIAFAGVVVSSCTAGSETAGIDRGGVRVPVVAEGPITGFGSIIVNGVHYDISNASIQVDRVVASASDLALGQLVTVVGERDETGATGRADSVVFQADVRGPIQAVDAAASEVRVLQQRVVIRPSTVLDLGAQPAAFSSLDVGEAVEVSGFITSDGAIDATRVKLVSAQSGPLIAGTVTNLDTATLRFNVRDLVVDYSAALVIEGFPSGGPSNGDEIVAEGTLSPTTGRFMVRELEREDAEHDGVEGREAEVEGRVTRFVSALDFDVAGRAVTAPSTTKYSGGSAASLVLNLKLHVHGRFDASGVIRASEIEIDD